MAHSEKTDPVAVCPDADVLIAGLLSRRGASHAILILGEIGLLQVVLPEAVVEEVRRNLAAKLPEAGPLWSSCEPLPSGSTVPVRSARGPPSSSRTTFDTSIPGRASASFGRGRSWRKPGRGWGRLGVSKRVSRDGRALPQPVALLDLKSPPTSQDLTHTRHVLSY